MLQWEPDGNVPTSSVFRACTYFGCEGKLGLGAEAEEEAENDVVNSSLHISFIKLRLVRII